MIIRTSRKNRYTHIPNDLIEDPALDWKELGLMVFLLSKPDNWEISVEHLRKQRKLGRDGIYKCLDAIIEAGYAIREKNKDGSVDWYIFDEKTTEKPEIKPNPEKPEKAKESQIRKSRKCDSEAKSGKAVIRKTRNTENPTQVNTELNKQELIKEITTDVCTQKKRATNSLAEIPADFAPSESCMKLIAKSGIPETFALCMIDEFVFYWTEQGEKRKSWNTTFLNRVKSAWEYKQKSPGTASNRHQGLPYNTMKGGNNYERKQKISPDAWRDTNF
jgi:hypothetical protein